jgi:hypothetical protein
MIIFESKIHTYVLYLFYTYFTAFQNPKWYNTFPFALIQSKQVPTVNAIVHSTHQLLIKCDFGPRLTKNRYRLYEI